MTDPNFYSLADKVAIVTGPLMALVPRSPRGFSRREPESSSPY